MTGLIEDKIEQCWELLLEGKLEEVLQIVNEYEKNEDLDPIEKLRFLNLKGTILSIMGKFERVIEIATYIYKEGVKWGKTLISIESVVLLKFGALFIRGKQYQVWKEIESCENLLKSAPQESSSEIEQAEALLSFMKGYFYSWEGEWDQAIENLKKSLPFFEPPSRYSYCLAAVLNIMGPAYLFKGELDKSLKYLMKSLEATKSWIHATKMINAGNYNWIGMIYHQQGMLDLAIDYFNKSLTIWEQDNNPISKNFVGIVTNNMIKVFLDKNSPEQAHEVLQYIYLYIEKNNLPKDIYWYKLAQARVLKSSKRTRERAEAEKILKIIIKGHDALRESGVRGIPYEFTDPIVELCDLYLEELYSTYDLDILNDLHPLINRLIRQSEISKSFSQLAHTNLLQGEISLLQMNMGDARRYLTRAQDIAEDHGLQLLGRAISKKHDTLMEKLDKLENIDKLDSDLSERLKDASFDEIIERMQGKRAIKVPELVNEKPVLLLVITEGGVPIFSYPFADEWKKNDELFASFLSAFTSFSSEFFSEGLDRAKFGQYTVLIKSVAELSSCYLFKGQTYLAKQKLMSFAKGIQNNTSIMQTFNKYYQSSQVMELRDFPFLEAFIREIFVTS